MKRTMLYILIPIFIILAILILVKTCFSPPLRSTTPNSPFSEFMNKKEPGSTFNLLEQDISANWYKVGLGNWELDHGILTASNGIGYFATYYDGIQDFILSTEIKAGEQANSGIFFRSKHPGFRFRPWPIGYEAQVDNHDPKNPTGSLYDLVTANPAPASDEEWFTMEIQASGPNIQIKVNNTLVVDTTNTLHKEGFIALQAHDFGSIVQFRNMKIKIPVPQSP